MIQVTFRPLGSDFGAWTPEHERKGNPFGSQWSDTLGLLERELDHLDAERIVVQVDLAESQIRRDGWPRADSRPRCDAVILHFDSRHGHLRYATDRFRGGTSSVGGKRVYMPGWQVNLRAIALGLEALRKVQRYGIAESGQQYTGWKALGTGSEAPQEVTPERVILFHAGIAETSWRTLHIDQRRHAVKMAKRKAHPDAGGSDEAFIAVSQAAATLGF